MIPPEPQSLVDDKTVFGTGNKCKRRKMTTGCPQCDEIQAKTGDDLAKCLPCEDEYLEWIITCARKKRKVIAIAIKEKENEMADL